MMLSSLESDSIPFRNESNFSFMDIKKKITTTHRNLWLFNFQIYVLSTLTDTSNNQKFSSL